TAGQSNLTVDAGMYQVASLGDFVWLDSNSNGLQDAGEPGIAGVTVQLMDGTGTNVLASTTTNASGLYSFTNLMPGPYVVRFVSPAGYQLTTANVGTNDAIDSDASVSTGKTGARTLASNQVDNTNDAGFLPAAIGDRVWS